MPQAFLRFGSVCLGRIGRLIIRDQIDLVENGAASVGEDRNGRKTITISPSEANMLQRAILFSMSFLFTPFQSKNLHRTRFLLFNVEL